jgi:hypothetical protein
MTAPRTPTRIGLAALSLGAALIHASTISAHEDETLLLVGFVLAAAAQGAWALIVVARPTARSVLAVGGALNAGLLAIYLATRLTGLPISGLEQAEPFGFKDVTCAAFEAALVVGCLLALRPHLVSRAHRLQPVAAALVAVAVAAVAVPALAAGEGHTHGAGGHAHDDTGHSDAGHSHDDTAGGDGHAHGTTDGITTAQQERADALVDETEDALPRWDDVDAAVADGFHWIGDGRLPGKYQHYISEANLASDDVLDADHPESLVYRNDGNGTVTLVSAMYILPRGSTMDDVPDVGGSLTPWHDHDNLCWGPDGQIAGALVNGRCTPGGTFNGSSPPMLHVWVVDNPCGRFAGIEGSGPAGGHGDTCDHSHS